MGSEPPAVIKSLDCRDCKWTVAHRWDPETVALWRASLHELRAAVHAAANPSHTVVREYWHTEE